jgi:hypothetical protein
MATTEIIEDPPPRIVCRWKPSKLAIELSKRRESLRFPIYTFVISFARGVMPHSIQGYWRGIVEILFDSVPEAAKIKRLHHDVTC